MALTKPILNAISAFDGTMIHTFQFSVLSGDQVVANTLTIRNNATNVIVYQDTQTTFKFEHEIPANTLINGVYYNAYIVTHNSSAQDSVASDTVQFYCYSTPTLSFVNVAEGGVVNSANLTAQLQYNQEQGELLNNYVISLYNASKIEIATSGTQYFGNPTVPPNVVSYKFGGLEDNTTYYITGEITTVNNTYVSTGFIQFTVSYTQPEAFSKLQLTNNCAGGYITVSSNVILLDGISNPDPAHYIDNDAVDLTSKGSWVEWKQGYTIQGDFTAKLWLTQPTDKSTLCIFSNETNQMIKLGYHIDQNDNTKVYADLIVDGKYYIYTDSVTKPLPSQQICIQMRRIGNLYDILLEVI